MTQTDANTIQEAFRLSYGEDSLQYADLRIPSTPGPHPVVVVIHGGCWRSKYDLTLMDRFCVDLTSRGYATWNIEYSRTEDADGAWPGTFLDVSRAMTHLVKLKYDYALDLDRLVVSGHSAGGHLALWLGTQATLDENSDIFYGELPKIRGVVSLAGITDLEAYIAPSGCGDNVTKLMGGTPSDFPERYLEASPISRLPMKIPQILINGVKDEIVNPELVRPYFEKAQKLKDSIQFIQIEEGDHFDVITPGSVAWESILNAIKILTEIQE